MNDELIYKTLTGLMTQQATMTKSVEKMGSAVDVLSASVNDLKSETEEFKAASAATEALFEDLKLIVEAFAHSSTDIQKRLTALEEHTGLKPAS